MPGSKGYYSSTLRSSNGPPALYLDPSAGPHTFNILGGADVGPRSVQDVQSAPALAWTNQATVSTVSESQGVPVNWTNTSPGGYVRVTGFSGFPNAVARNGSALVACFWTLAG